MGNTFDVKRVSHLVVKNGAFGVNGRNKNCPYLQSGYIQIIEFKHIPLQTLITLEINKIFGGNIEAIYFV